MSHNTLGSCDDSPVGRVCREQLRISIDVMPIRRSQGTEAATSSVNRSLLIVNDPDESADRNAGRKAYFEIKKEKRGRERNLSEKRSLGGRIS